MTNKNNIKVFMTGGWGYGNIGDDAIMMATLNSLHKRIPNVKVVVTSFDPVETRFHHGVDSLYSFHYFLDIRHLYGKLNAMRFMLWLIIRGIGIKASWILGARFGKLIDALEESDTLLMAGGGYFNDRWRGSFISRLAEIWAGKATGKKIMIYGQTVGPFASKLASWILPVSLRNVDHIGYRDVQSERVLKKFDYPMERATLTADEANLLPLKQQDMLDQPAHREPKVGVMIQKFRPYESADGTEVFGEVKTVEEYVKRVVAALVSLHKKTAAEFVFLPSTTWDTGFCGDVKNQVERILGKTFEMISGEPIAKYVEQCRNVDVMLSTNMHPVILASAAGVPCIAISYFYKVDDFMESVGLGDAVVRIDAVTEERLVNAVLDALSNHDVVATKIRSNLPAVHERAERNCTQFGRLIGLVV
jgi:polysaccharide pyruvyl transferase WcaK-like protein